MFFCGLLSPDTGFELHVDVMTMSFHCFCVFARSPLWDALEPRESWCKCVIFLSLLLYSMRSTNRNRIRLIIKKQRTLQFPLFFKLKCVVNVRLCEIWVGEVDAGVELGVNLIVGKGWERRRCWPCTPLHIYRLTESHVIICGGVSFSTWPRPGYHSY